MRSFGSKPKGITFEPNKNRKIKPFQHNWSSRLSFAKKAVR